MGQLGNKFFWDELTDFLMFVLLPEVVEVVDIPGYDVNNTSVLDLLTYHSLLRLREFLAMGGRILLFTE